MTRFPFADDVRAVLFDAGNTLMPIDHARIAEIVRGSGAACSEDDVRLAEMRARPRLDPYVRSAAKRESGDAIARYVGCILDGLGGAAQAAAPAVAGAWRELWTRPGQDAHAVLETLSARGLPLGVVSNSNGAVRGLLERAGLAARLSCVVDSGVVGVEKPDPRIFAMAAEALGVEARTCVYVGDFLSLDAHGARAAGMHGVLLDPIGAWGEVDVPRVASLTEFAQRLL